MSKQLVRMNDGRLNLANMFTVARLPVAVLGLVLWAADYRLLGVLVIMVAAWTDFLDGLVARKLNCDTPFGAKFDPIVDKVFTAIIIVFVLMITDRGVWMIWLVTVSELLNALVTLYSEFVLRRGIKVTWFGKKGMFGKMAAVTWLLLANVSNGPFWDFAFGLSIFCGVIGTLLGLIAFAQYIHQTRQK